MIKILLDHPDAEAVGARLRAAGYDVRADGPPTEDTAALEGLLDRGAADGRTVVTTNPAMANPETVCPERHPGIVLVAFPSVAVDDWTERLVVFLEGKIQEQLHNHVIILSGEEDQWIQHLRFARDLSDESIVIPRGSRERFLVAPEPLDQLLDGYDVALAGISEVVPPYRVYRKGMAFHLVLLILDGEGQFGSGRDAIPLGQGVALKAPAGSAYEYRAASAWRFLWFHLRQGEKWDALFGVDCEVEEGLWSQALYRAAEGFLDEAGRRRPDAGIPLRAYADLIVFHLDRDLGGVVDPARLEERDRIERVWRAVHDDPAAPWDVSRMARLARVSVTHFHRLVRRHTRSSPMQVVTRVRMDRARELLRHTHFTMEQIADLTGYQSPFALSKAFKRQSGLSPHEFRHLDAGPQDGNPGYEAGSREHGARPDGEAH